MADDTVQGNMMQNTYAIDDKISLENRLEIIDEAVRKKYLTRVATMDIAPIQEGEFALLEDDVIDNIRLFKITEMVYGKGESVTDKFTTVFNTLSTYNASVFVLIDSDGKKNTFYLGVRNNEPDSSSEKRSTVTLGDTLKNTLKGHFPGVKIDDSDRKAIMELATKINAYSSVASVSVVGNNKIDVKQSNEQFVQGIEKLVLAMSGRPYIGLIIADNRSPDDIQSMRKNYQELYTKLSPWQRRQLTKSESSSKTHSKSFAEMSAKQKKAMIASSVVSLAGMGLGGFSGIKNNLMGIVGGAMIGSQVSGQLNGFINAIAPNEQINESYGQTTTTTVENKEITDMLTLLDNSLKKINEYDSYGMWDVAGYFISNDMSTAEIAASNYRSLMNGEDSGREVSAINAWFRNGSSFGGDFADLTTYLSRFVHPRFIYGGNILVNAATSVSGKELGLHLGLPRATVSGLPVIEHAEFGKEVNTYQLVKSDVAASPEDRITIGRIFDLGQETDKKVELNSKSLSMHTFITGSTGSGKSNAVYQILTELRQDNVPFLVIEPAKGEYKDVFGHLPDVRVFSTNPAVAQLVNINPFRFPKKAIHVLEHIDGLVEIFSACWPMYDAMPAFFKDAILNSYEAVGWDLSSSTFAGSELEYPDFEILAEQLNALIEDSDYAAEVKSNYRGALLTRVKSLTIGLNRSIFTTKQTPYEQLFDENCILDISRVKSSETKALIMGLTIYILNEYRMDQKNGSNHTLSHVTVLEEAHNLLKNTNGMDMGLIGKSIEMITNTIAEIRTFGEGFMIVDQSPSSVDIAAIKNTNTKIVLRTPEANDRETIGRSIGLTANQVNEIAKLPTGVAVVYQNDWLSPVLTMINKADVEEKNYVYNGAKAIKSARQARSELLAALLEPYITRPRMSGRCLRKDLDSLNLGRGVKKELEAYIKDYIFYGCWRILQEEQTPLQNIIKNVLGMTDAELMRFVQKDDADGLRTLVKNRTSGFESNEIEVICQILTK